MVRQQNNLKSPQTVLQEVILAEMVRGPTSSKSQMAHTEGARARSVGPPQAREGHQLCKCSFNLKPLNLGQSISIPTDQPVSIIIYSLKLSFSGLDIKIL